MPITVHKLPASERKPLVSIILLDWSVREHFQALTWLAEQDVPREAYELIWVELYDRVVPQSLDAADTVITCGQKGIYHKHSGYNVGLLHARGTVVTVCDSDAVFPRDFVSSIVDSFGLEGEGRDGEPLVLMHYEWRTAHLYPDDLRDTSQLSRYVWKDLWPNVGACMSVRRIDAICFGGFDEHPSYRGYICGPYELGWRLVNAGIPEVWHDEKVALWHFAHPDPVRSFGGRLSAGGLREITCAHVEHHALEAVDAFSSGRLLPLLEHPEVHALRLSLRRIGTKYEEKYATMTGAEGFSAAQRLVFRAKTLKGIVAVSLSTLSLALRARSSGWRRTRAK